MLAWGAWGGGVPRAVVWWGCRRRCWYRRRQLLPAPAAGGAAGADGGGVVRCLHRCCCCCRCCWKASLPGADAQNSERGFLGAGAAAAAARQIWLLGAGAGCGPHLQLLIPERVRRPGSRELGVAQGGLWKRRGGGEACGWMLTAATAAPVGGRACGGPHSCAPGALAWQHRIILWHWRSGLVCGTPVAAGRPAAPQLATSQRPRVHARNSALATAMRPVPRANSRGECSQICRRRSQRSLPALTPAAGPSARSART